MDCFTLSLTSALDGVGWSAPRLGRLTLGTEFRYPFYRRLGGPQDWTGEVRKTSPSTGIQSPDRSESLYRLRSPGPFMRLCTEEMTWKYYSNYIETSM